MHKIRRELGLSLQEIEERAARLGVRIPLAARMQIERGDLDPAVRCWLALLHVDNVEVLADAMELGGLAGGGTPPGDLEELTERGTQAWKSGDIREALRHALAVREHPAEDARSQLLKQGALICFATYARNLGKFRLAQCMVHELLLQPLSRRELTETLVLAASIWSGLGSSEAALAMVERAAKRVEPHDLQRVAYVEHQWAKLLLRSGEPKEAEHHLDRAVALYRQVSDPYNEARALQLRTDVLEALGRAEAALACAHEIVERARKLDYGCLLSTALLELGRLLLARSRNEEAVEFLRQGLAAATVLGDRRVQLYAHARLWRAYRSLGQPQAAAQSLRRAAELVDRADESSPELDEVRRAVTPVRRRARTPRRQARESVN